MRVGVAVCCLLLQFAYAAAVEEDVEVPGKYLKVRVAPGDGAGAELFQLNASPMNQSAHDGLMLEGFGVGNHYVPNRRLNESLTVLESIRDRPVLQFTYECDGPNIRGLHVTRTMEPMLEEASVRVTLRVEHKGDEEQWVAPWVRNEVAPGGKFDANDRIDVPSTEGIRAAVRSGYFSAARNWIAATDSSSKETVFAVFHADETHSFLALRDEDEPYCGFQTAFVPRLMKKGDSWETRYRVNAVRGLSHVSFATDELAAQVDYADGTLTLLIAPTQAMPDLTILASVLAPNGRVWRLSPKSFDLQPGTLVRCTYDWPAPADGPYEFLAKLTRGGADVKLGEDTGSPHGGIDTQFVVGKPAAIQFEPWTDAPFALDRGVRTLRRAMAADSTASIWLEGPLEKIFPEDRAEPTGSIQSTARVFLARGEAESFQIVVRPPDDSGLEDFRAVVRDLNGDSGVIPAKNVLLHRVVFHPVRISSHFEGPTGDWPDALPAFEPHSLPAGRCSVIWVTVSVPREASPGAYEGLIELVSPALGSVPITLRADVWDFQLPVTPALKTDFGFWPENAEALCKRFGYEGTTQELNDRYLSNALAHRVTLRALTQLPSESADYAGSLRRFDARRQELERRGASTFSVPASLLDTPQQLQLANEYVKTNGLTSRVFCQIADEPERPSWPRLFDTMTTWRQLAPDIPLMLTTHGIQPFFHEAAHIWAIHTPVMDTLNNRAVLEYIAAGNETWWYVNHTPPRPYANFFLDFAAIEHRILFWQTWALGLKGLHYWNVNYSEPGVNPWTHPTDVTPVNGDGLLVYPGPDGPVSSIRWETIRDGIEDYDYLVLFREWMKRLEEKGGNAALLNRVREVYNLKTVVPDLVTFPRDPNVLLKKREEIGNAIVEMQRALG